MHGTGDRRDVLNRQAPKKTGIEDQGPRATRPRKSPGRPSEKAGRTTGVCKRKVNDAEEKVSKHKAPKGAGTNAEKSIKPPAPNSRARKRCRRIEAPKMRDVKESNALDE